MVSAAALWDRVEANTCTAMSGRLYYFVARSGSASAATGGGALRAQCRVPLLKYAKHQGTRGATTVGLLGNSRHRFINGVVMTRISNKQGDRGRRGPAKEGPNKAAQAARQSELHNKAWPNQERRNGIALGQTLHARWFGPAAACQKETWWIICSNRVERGFENLACCTRPVLVKGKTLPVGSRPSGGGAATAAPRLQLRQTARTAAWTDRPYRHRQRRRACARLAPPAS
jgi:hypothetical protein